MDIDLNALLARLGARPGLYEPGDVSIWTDRHLAQGMLAAHLDDSTDAASFRPEKRRALLGFLDTLCPAREYARVLDLGCGPGLIASELARGGRQVVGVDFSANSIAYARAQAGREGLTASYIHGDYLTADLGCGYDLAIMISYDYTVLSPADRALLMSRVYAALRPGGVLLLDVFTLNRRMPPEAQRFHTGNGGYWSPGEYLLLERDLRYEGEVHLRQCVLLDGRGVRGFHIWEHFFTPEEMEGELRAAGFTTVERYADHAGAAFEAGGETLIAVARK